VFDRVCMVQTSCFKKLLDVVCQVSLLAFEVTFGSHDTLLVGAVCFLVVVVEAGSKCDPLGASFLPPFATFGAFSGAMVGGFGRCPTATTRGHFPIALDKDDPNCLLASGVLGGDIKQLLWLGPFGTEVASLLVMPSAPP
jgi:hypothetical protein